MPAVMFYDEVIGWSPQFQKSFAAGDRSVPTRECGLDTVGGAFGASTYERYYADKDGDLS